MPAGFGFSVGDFIAVLNLIATIIDALRESGSACSSFQALVQDLEELKFVLLQIQQLHLDDRLRDQKLGIDAVATQCLRTIQAFWMKVQKYEPHLQTNGTRLGVKDAWARIKWTVDKKDDVEDFRARLRGHTGSLALLMLKVQLQVTTINAKDQNVQHTSMMRSLQVFTFQIMHKLDTVARNVAQSVQQGKALLDASAQAVSSNLQVFNMVQTLQGPVLYTNPQLCRQQPVYLIDPWNKESPFHLEFIRSADALLSVVKANFRTAECNERLIDRGDFVIEEMGTQAAIDLTKPWVSCFSPGQRVAMSVIFRQTQKVPAQASSCPKCLRKYFEATDREIIW
jgi:hypothetical protein